MKSIKIDANHATLHEQLVRFALAVQKATSAKTLKPSVKAVIDKHWSELYGSHGQDLNAFNAGFIEKTKTQGSVADVISAAMSVYLIDPSKNLTKAEELLFSAEEEKFGRTRTLENVVLVQKTLKGFKSARQPEWRAKAKVWFPNAAAFK